ncbi:hypothetical protein [Alteromonas lipotrueiana]|uniref:hypothetical protein n=1 Tax=Alteromonas lipotrueiana TaxID=2803815 RepID=UPI001C44FC01|nr:hypothetical protein [Alteromonas lipotrueiana]
MIKQRIYVYFPFIIGAVAAFSGLVTFVISWYFYDYWGGPVPGYSVFLFVGNISLEYIWHPLLTEEISLYPKLGLMLMSQFVLCSMAGAIIKYGYQSGHRYFIETRRQKNKKKPDTWAVSYIKSVTGFIAVNPQYKRIFIDEHRINFAIHR